MLDPFSTASSVFKIETYLVAMRMAISSFGLCVFGLFCTSSYRKREGRSYQTTVLIFCFNFLISVLSTIATLAMLWWDQRLRFGLLTSMQTKIAGIRFAVAAIPEHFARLDAQLMSSTLIMYYIPPLLMNISSSFGIVFVIHALLRDFLPGYNVVFKWLSMSLFCCASATYFVFVTMKLGDGDVPLEAYIINCTKYFFICLNVVVFVHIYGSHDYELDTASILGERQGWSSVFNATWTLRAYSYSIIAVMVVQVIECNRTLSWLQFRQLYGEDYVEKEKISLSEWQYLTMSLIVLSLYLFPFLKPAWDIITIDTFENIRELFNISSAHPSYERRTDLRAFEKTAIGDVHFSDTSEKPLESTSSRRPREADSGSAPSHRTPSSTSKSSRPSTPQPPQSTPQPPTSPLEKTKSTTAASSGTATQSTSEVSVTPQHSAPSTPIPN
ncbi:hypothetical protein RB195_011225 [Necator americanus]